jgi:hypothetical protein
MGYCSILGTGTVKGLESLRRVFQKQYVGGSFTEKMQKKNPHKEENSKGGEQFPAIQMNSAKKQSD